MNHFKILLSLAIIFSAAAVSAEFYKYYDESGNVHFTDDYNKVPVDQRPNVKGYEEYENADTAESEAANQSASGKENPDDTAASDETENAFDPDAKLKEFDRIKKELAQEYEALMKENAKLAEQKKQIQTAEDIKRYNEQVAALNQKIKEHDHKRKAFFATVEEYNAQVAQRNSKKKEK